MTTIEELNKLAETPYYAARYSLLRKAASEIEALQKENEQLRETIAINREAVEIGMRWKRNSALEEWFPITAEQLKQLQHDIIAYRTALGYSVPADHDGKLTNGEIPQCGPCNSAHGKELERDKERLEWAIENHVLRFPRFSKDDGNFVNFTLLTSRHAIDAAMQENP